MNKKVIIILIVCIVIFLSSFFIYKLYYTNSTNTINSTDTIEITYFAKNGEFTGDKKMVISDKQTISEILDICQDIEETTSYESNVIMTTIKLDLKNGTIFLIDTSIPDYCYVNKNNSDISTFILMPDGLYNYLNNLLY